MDYDPKTIVFVGVTSKTSLIFGLAGKGTRDGTEPRDESGLELKVTYEGKLGKLNICNTTGLEVYDRYRHLQYTGAHVYVICYSMNDRQSYYDVEETWIPELTGLRKAFYLNPNTPKILVALEDGIIKDEVRVTLQMGEDMKKKTNCVAFMWCSLKSGNSELLDKICECAFFPEKFKPKTEVKDNSIFGKLIYGYQSDEDDEFESIDSPTETKKEDGDVSIGGDLNSESSKSEKKKTGILGKLKKVFSSKPGKNQAKSSENEQSTSPEIKKETTVARNFNDYPVEEWTPEEVGKWLESKGCNQNIIQILKTQEFNGTALLYCGKQDLTSLSIPLGYAITILKWVEPLKKPSEESSLIDNKQSGTNEEQNSFISAYEFAKSSSSGNTHSSSFEIDMSELSPKSTYNQDNEFEKRYNIIDKLGNGGFGSVYKVMTKKSNQIRAVKIVAPNQYFTVNQALSEALKQAQLYRDDNHIVHVFDVFIAVEEATQRQIVCIEMDLMQGSVRSIFKNRTISEGMIWSILRQIGACLKFLSETGNIVHRDIKPDNILVKKVDFEQDEIEVYLSDFGLAKYNSNSTQISTISGTFLFIAPEILDHANSSAESNRSPYSVASDIFALGVSVYQIMTNDTSSNIATLCMYGRDLIKQNFPQDFYSEKLINLVLEMLERYPQNRPSINDILTK